MSDVLIEMLKYSPFAVFSLICIFILARVYKTTNDSIQETYKSNIAHFTDLISKLDKLNEAINDKLRRMESVFDIKMDKIEDSFDDNLDKMKTQYRDILEKTSHDYYVMKTMELGERNKEKKSSCPFIEEIRRSKDA